MYATFNENSCGSIVSYNSPTNGSDKTNISILNDKYKNFVTGHMEAAAECIPTKLRAQGGIS